MTDTGAPPTSSPDTAARVRAALPHEPCISGAVEILKVCADLTRMKILLALRGREMRVGDLALVAGISESAASHQLRLLRAHRVVAFRKEGRTAWYRLADDHVATLLENALDHAHEGHGS